MNILRLFRGGPPASRRFLFAITSFTGLGNAGLIGLINQAAEQSLLGAKVGAQLLIVYALTLAFFLLSNRTSLHQANRYVQSRLEATRRRIVTKIRRADLRTLERLGQGDIYITVAQETDHLSQTLPLLIGAAQSAFVLAFLLLYIATLSLISFAVVAGVTALGLTIFVIRQRALTASLAAVHHREAEMLDSLSHFTLGFQEIRLNADRNDGLFAHFTEVADSLKDEVIAIGGRWVALLQFSNAFKSSCLSASSSSYCRRSLPAIPTPSTRSPPPRSLPSAPSPRSPPSSGSSAAPRPASAMSMRWRQSSTRTPPLRLKRRRASARRSGISRPSSLPPRPSAMWTAPA